jgi:hypothetical protein
MTEAMCREAWEAVKQAGSVLGAVRATGMPENMLEGRYSAALIRFNMPEVRPAHPNYQPPPARFTAPELAEEKPDLEELLDRREREFARKRAANDAREWMEFGITEVAPFGLVFVGDPHIDDDGCDIALLRRHLALIEATPGMHGVGMGDWVNSWVGRLERLYGDQGTTKAQAWHMAEWLLGKPIWMLMLLGNHDLWHGAGSPLRWMARGHAVMSDWQAKFQVRCGDRVWRIWAAHDFPGNSMWNRLHAPGRRATLTGHDADLFIAAHRHCFGLAEQQDEHTGRVSWLARCKGYKVLDSYAAGLGYGQAQDRGHSIVAVCDPATGRMRCFSDVAEGAEFLTYLRKPRVRVQAGRAA